MPNNKEHARLSKSRTGKQFTKLHKWMNEDCLNPNINPKRHETTNIPENMEIARKKFGNEAVQGFLYRIKEDYEKNKVYKILQVVATIKRAVYSSLNGFKGMIKNN